MAARSSMIGRMPRIVVVRHGSPIASAADAADPGLDDLGWSQARTAAGVLAEQMVRPIISSPKRRALETAAPLVETWGAELVVDHRFGEMPSPLLAPADRRTWLRALLGRRWIELSSPEDGALHAWREGILEGLGALASDSIVFSHYLVLNVIVAAATGDDRLVCFRPDHTSRTVFDVNGGTVHLVERGVERATRVV